jgi:uncharacterized protein YdaU (DUF1376 family)
MAEFPSLPLWTDAYLADTGHLSLAEHGAYLLLLIHLWRAPRQRFPNDDAWLARKFRQDEIWVRESLRPLIKEFCATDGNWITQKRLAREFLYVSARSQAQTERIKRRWEKEKSLYRGNTPAGNTPTPTPTVVKEEKNSLPSPEEKEINPLRGLPKKAVTRGTSLPEGFPDAVAVSEAITIWERKGEEDAVLAAVCVDLSTRAQEIVAEFRDHHTAHGKTMRDWRAAWRTWVRNAIKFDARRPPHGRESAHARFARELAEHAGFEFSFRDDVAGGSEEGGGAAATGHRRNTGAAAREVGPAGDAPRSGRGVAAPERGVPQIGFAAGDGKDRG